jgi:hypothetical protein
MKKLKLKLDGVKEMLTKEQMKKISGGYSGTGHYVTCSIGCDAGHYACCEDVGTAICICVANGWNPVYGSCSYSGSWCIISVWQAW